VKLNPFKEVLEDAWWQEREFPSSSEEFSTTRENRLSVPTLWHRIKYWELQNPVSITTFVIHLALANQFKRKSLN